jgi:hypothetical protein
VRRGRRRARDGERRTTVMELVGVAIQTRREGTRWGWVRRGVQELLAPFIGLKRHGRRC